MLIKRVSTIRCDRCQATAEVEHDLNYIGDMGYDFHRGMDELGWMDVWGIKEASYVHLCLNCYNKGDE